MTQVRVFRRQQGTHTPSRQSSNVEREEFIAEPGRWVGIVRMPPGSVSDWHHHGDHDTYVYVISGRVRLEYGPGGHGAAEAGPGDVLHMPRRLVHRHVNPGPDEHILFGVRVGEGPTLFPVEGPEG